MAGGEIFIKNGQLSGWHYKRVAKPPKESGEKLEKLGEILVSAIVVETGAKRYGLPADAKERRM